ncbi:MAG: sensor histidine kinase [Saprospiraceae bacterium]
MFNHIKVSYKKLANIGVTHDLPHIEKVKIRILNQCTSLCLIASLLLFIQSRILERGDAIVELITVSLFLFPIILHALKNYLLPRLIATVFFPVFIFGLSVTYGPKSSVEFIYFSSILITLILYENILVKIINILGIVFIFCANFYVWDVFGGVYPMKPSLFNDAVIFFSVTLAIALIVHNFFTEHKRNYQKQIIYNNTLADRNEKLEHYIAQNEAKNQLIQIVAHDLKNPAATFLNLTQKMSYLIQQQDSKRILDFANHIENSGTKFFYTLDTLLNWVMSQQEGIKVSNKHIDLGELISDLQKSMSQIISDKQLDIVSMVPKDTVLYSDGNMVKIILNNIFHNAAKFSPVKEKIIITYDLIKGFDEITITDFGQGINAEALKQIRQGDTNTSTLGTQNEKGYGLGLKICFRMIHFLNGTIKINSNPGSGCKISVRIPRRIQTENKVAKPKSFPLGQRVSDD